MPPPASARAKRVQAIEPALDVLDYPPIENKNKPPKDFSEYVRCFFGQKGFGKSTLASQFPGHLTLMFEPRRRNLEIWQLNLQKQTAQQIIDGGPDVFRQVVNTTQRWIDDPTVLGLNFDSIDIFYECCQASVCARHNILVPGDAGKSSSDIWLEIRDEWAVYFDLLGASRLSINMLSHVTGRDNEDLQGGKFQLKSPSCPPACLKYIKQACDFVFYYGRYNGKRAIQIRDVYDIAFVAAGVGFLQPDGKPIYYLEMPDLTDAKTGYQVLVEAFEGKHWDIDTPEDQRIVPGAKPIAKPGPRLGPRRA